MQCCDKNECCSSYLMSDWRNLMGDFGGIQWWEFLTLRLWGLLKFRDSPFPPMRAGYIPRLPMSFVFVVS